MKKILSILALVLAMTMLMSVSAFATAEFSVEETDVPANSTITADADSIAVTVPATAGADYSVLLVNGSDLPTSETGITYINQVQADGNTVTFNVLPKLGSCGAACTLYIGTNAAGESLITIPVTYAEPAPTNDYITSADTSKATIAVDKAGVSDPKMGIVVGKNIVQLDLDVATYPKADAAAPAYNVAVVNATDGSAIDGAVVYYSAERKEYVAVVPAKDAEEQAIEYKFEVLGEGTDNAVIATYGLVSEIAGGMKNLPNYAQFMLIYKGAANSPALNNAKKALLADVTGDGALTLPDYAQFMLAYKGQSSNFPVLKK